MTRPVIITCAVTGGSDVAERHPGLPKTPREIADACREAADAGAAIVHIHVRDPSSGKPSRDRELFRTVVELIRADSTDVLVNLTTGIGGDFAPDDSNPALAAEGTDMLTPTERVAHVADNLPELCSLDCGTMNFDDGNLAYICTPMQLRAMARAIGGLGVKPELEVFDLGHVMFANQLIEEGLVSSPPLMQICLGVKWGAPAQLTSLMAMRDRLPEDAVWFAFGVGRAQMPMAAASVLMGGHVRVGLEDNLYLSRGQLATNGELVSRAGMLVEFLGAEVASTATARELLGL